MSTREQAVQILNQLTEEQLIPEEEPDAWDREMIADSKEENTESMKLDDFVKELGLQPDDYVLPCNGDVQLPFELNEKVSTYVTQYDMSRSDVDRFINEK